MRKILADTLVLCSLLLSAGSLCAAGIYPRPQMPAFAQGDETLGCAALNREISRLAPETYSSKPGFYEDPYHGASIWGGAVWAPGAWSYLAYSGVAEYAEYARTQEARNRIEALRYLKARRRCHE